MVSNVINGLIGSVVGAVAFIAVKAMVGGSIYGPDGTAAYNATTATAGELMIHDILPLAIAIMVVAGLFLGLTRLKGA